MKRGSFIQVDSQGAVAPGLQVTVRKNAIAFPSTCAAVQDARYVQIRIDATNHRAAFLFTPHPGEGSFTLSFDPTKAKPLKVASCVAVLQACPWLKPGRYSATQDYRRYWIIDAGDSPEESNEES